MDRSGLSEAPSDNFVGPGGFQDFIQSAWKERAVLEHHDRTDQLRQVSRFDNRLQQLKDLSLNVRVPTKLALEQDNLFLKSKEAVNLTVVNARSVTELKPFRPRPGQIVKTAFEGEPSRFCCEGSRRRARAGRNGVSPTEGRRDGVKEGHSGRRGAFWKKRGILEVAIVENVAILKNWVISSRDRRRPPE